MEYQEAKYIIDYFPRLMTTKERKALKQFRLSNKLKDVEKYKNFDQYHLLKERFKEKLGYEENSDLLQMFDKGYKSFVLQTAQRISEETPLDFHLNKCPNCDFLARTPYAKQCRNCTHNWHKEIGAELLFDTSFKIAGSPYLWIVGELLKGDLRTAYRIDFTNFQMNIIAEIKQIEFCLKSVDGLKKDLPSLGIEVTDKQEKLINQYLNKSAKTLMVLKET